MNIAQLLWVCDCKQTLSLGFALGLSLFTTTNSFKLWYNYNLISLHQNSWSMLLIVNYVLIRLHQNYNSTSLNVNCNVLISLHQNSWNMLLIVNYVLIRLHQNYKSMLLMINFQYLGYRGTLIYGTLLYLELGTTRKH